MSRVERAPLSRERITAAGRQHVEAVGLHELSLRAVARSLGVTGAALYRHVGNKRELVELIAADAFEELAADFRAIAASEPLDRLRAQAVVYVGFARAHPQLYRVMMQFPPALMASPSAESGERAGVSAFEPATHAFEASFAAVVEGISSGVLAPIDPVIAALTLWSAMHGLVEVLLMGLALPDAMVDELTASATDAVLRGLMVDPERVH